MTPKNTFKQFCIFTEDFFILYFLFFDFFPIAKEKIKKKGLNFKNK